MHMLKLIMLHKDVLSIIEARPLTWFADVEMKLMDVNVQLFVVKTLPCKHEVFADKLNLQRFSLILH